ncbi:hypothetical protein Tco_1070340 [Tanacetum coccineum]|uniref:Uncharacterized protein n=1 Tax=Tanacetum coccineum TaxID=301880 RepID=A0ABQ5HL25_9ASTR
MPSYEMPTSVASFDSLPCPTETYRAKGILIEVVKVWVQNLQSQTNLYPQMKEQRSTTASSSSCHLRRAHYLYPLRQQGNRIAPPGVLLWLPHSGSEIRLGYKWYSMGDGGCSGRALSRGWWVSQKTLPGSESVKRGIGDKRMLQQT